MTHCCQATEALIKAAGGMDGASVEEIGAEASEAMEQLWEGCELMPGAERVLKHLAAKGVRCRRRPTGCVVVGCVIGCCHC